MQKKGGDVIGWLSRYATILFLLLLVIGFSFARPEVFATQLNLLNVLNQASILLIISSGLTVCLVMGLFDLSIASMATLGGYLVCKLLVDQGENPHLWLTLTGVLIFAGAVLQLHEHAVEVNGMLHHRVVHQHQAYPFAILEGNWGLRVRILFAVERPDVAFHVAREMEFDFAGGLAAIRGGRKAFQIPIHQHAPLAALESRAGFIESAASHHGDRGVPRAVGIRPVRHGWAAGQARSAHRRFGRSGHLGARGGHVHSRHRVGGRGRAFHAGHIHAHVGHRAEGARAAGWNGGGHAGTTPACPA